MFFKQLHYEALLTQYSHYSGALSLLKEYRLYLEMIPSMRRPKQSVITIPLPIVKVRASQSSNALNGIHIKSEEATLLPCDVAILTCDPDWKIKTGVEIFIFIHRPHEDFSDLLSRWRKTQLLLTKDYEWVMPIRYKHILSDGSDASYPLFVLLPETPERISKGLRGAGLPFVIQSPDLPEEDIEQEIEGHFPQDLELGTSELS